MTARYVPKLARGKTTRSQARELIWRVSEFMANESKLPDEQRIPVQQSLERTAAACGVSKSLIKNIRREKKAMDSSAEGESSFSTPKKYKRKSKVVELDDFDKCVVRRTVNDFYKTDNSLPTLKLLKNKLSEKINYEGGLTSLRTILRSIGFRWKKIENNRKILIETNDIRIKRINYLRHIKQARAENTPIVYIDESYILSSHVTEKGWTDDSVEGYKKKISKGDRAIILHAGGEMGFIPGACLIWKAGTSEGDYHDQMNHSNFMTWTKTQLIPNIPPKSLIVIDNAPYHNVQINKAPNSNSKKEDMIKWLQDRGLQFNPTTLKPELYNEIKQNKEKFKTFAFDELVENHGHSVLRLPPYHPDLNPIENIWGIIKNYVGQKNVVNKIQNTIVLCKEKINSISTEDWVKVCKKVIAIENEYYEKEHLIDSATERFIIRLGDSSGESDSDLDKNASGSEDSADESGGRPNSPQLATPL